MGLQTFLTTIITVFLLGLSRPVSAAVHWQAAATDQVTLEPSVAVGGPLTAEECASNPAWAGLYESIDRDLEPFRAQGISQATMDSTIREEDYHWKWRRVSFLVEQGKVYIISNYTLPKEARHHRGLITAHVMVMVKLAQMFGTAIPDVEFAVSTADDPSVRLDTLAPGQPLVPLFRFCKTDSHADILVPYIHFNMRSYDARLLSQANRFKTAHPWASKKEVVFGRFSPYNRFHHVGINSTYKKGQGGMEICRSASPMKEYCMVRTHFIEWSQKARRKLSAPLDVRQQPRVDMMGHAEHKWLLHLDGQTCSSRLEQLLALGSLVVREASGYRSFYHHLLQPGVHYVPFWKELPEEILDVVQWARSHDGEAQKIAAAGQEFALTYLNKRARACYWLTLLQRFSKLLNYKPGIAAGRNYTHRIEAEDWLGSRAGRKLVSKFKLDVEV